MLPMVIWMGSEPLKNRGKFRLVNRGPAREGRPDDVPFSVEQCHGIDMMKKKTWGEPDQQSGGLKLCVWALSHALGQVLTVNPKELDCAHPLFCELNMAVIEKRKTRGCDCGKPRDPLEGK